MKHLKRITAIVLALVIMAGAFILPTSAAAQERGASDGEKVVRMYFGHRPRYAYLSGHTWLYFENLTNHDVQVGLYTVKPGKGVSVGSYGYDIEDGRGVYYNVEAHRYNSAKVNDYVYLSTEITEKQLERVSEKILLSGTWFYMLNCSYFAITTWDVVSKPFLMYMVIPTFVHLQVIMNPNHGTGFKMYYPSRSEVFKQVGRGDNARLEPANPDSTGRMI